MPVSPIAVPVNVPVTEVTVHEYVLGKLDVNVKVGAMSLQVVDALTEVMDGLEFTFTLMDAGDPTQPVELVSVTPIIAEGANPKSTVTEDSPTPELAPGKIAPDAVHV